LINPLNVELNPICHLLALLGDHPILHVSRIRVKRSLHQSPYHPVPSVKAMCKQREKIIYTSLHVQTNTPTKHTEYCTQRGHTDYTVHLLVVLVRKYINKFGCKYELTVQGS
jgi:hypothetical protein